MLYVFTKRAKRFGFNLFLADWGKAFRRQLRILSYEEVFRRRRVPLGNTIFTDLDELTAPQLAKAAILHRSLAAAEPPVQLLNHPLGVWQRYELLRNLHEGGINRYDVYRLDEGRWPKRYPVFLRSESDHTGPESPLLHREVALVAALEQRRERGLSRHNTLIVEYLDYGSPDGLFRKYGAFVIAGQVIPRHLQVGRDWAVKHNARDLDEYILAEERHYLESNPHAEVLGAIAAKAGIDYGRIDYTVVDGQIQVFEINTNPQILTPGGSFAPQRTAFKQLFCERFSRALAALSAPRARPHHRRSLPLCFEPRPWWQRRPPVEEIVLDGVRWLGGYPLEPVIHRRLLQWRRALQGRFDGRQ
ncbi:MAG: hypothetical protein ACFCBW_11410 [Candidatus Competibacterales bacterium]